MLRYGAQQDFPDDWADDLFIKTIEEPNELMFWSFLDNCKLDKFLCGELTPLMHTAAEGRYQLALRLLINGAAPELVNDAGKTAVDLANENGHPQLATLISNACSNENWTELVETHMEVRKFLAVVREFQDDARRDESIGEIRACDMIGWGEFYNLKKRVLVNLSNDTELWFKATENINFGVRENEDDLVWMIDGKEVKERIYW